MKLHETTLETLKNFSQINTSLLLRKGTFQKTMKDDESLLAEATLVDEIPVDAPIYDLPQFLGLLGMMKEPDLEFSPTSVVLDDGELKLNYRFSAANLIPSIPDDVLEISEPDAKFSLLEGQLVKLLKVASALGLPNMIVTGGPDGVFVNIGNKKDDSTHKGAIKISNDPVKEFEATWLTEHLLIVPGNYSVTVSTDGLSILENDNGTRKYYISLQTE